MSRCGRCIPRRDTGGHGLGLDRLRLVVVVKNRGLNGLAAFVGTHGQWCPLLREALAFIALANTAGQDWHVDNLAQGVVGRSRFGNMGDARVEIDAVVDVGQLGGFRVGLKSVAGCIARSWRSGQGFDFKRGDFLGNLAKNRPREIAAKKKRQQQNNDDFWKSANGLNVDRRAFVLTKYTFGELVFFLDGCRFPTGAAVVGGLGPFVPPATEETYIT